MYDDSGSFDITSDDAVVGDFSKNVVERAAAAKFTIEQYYHNFFRSEKEREGRYDLRPPSSMCLLFTFKFHFNILHSRFCAGGALLDE